ncbi:MAG: DUF4038 domain-containing protein [Pseudomonadota bacterium]
MLQNQQSVRYLLVFVFVLTASFKTYAQPLDGQIIVDENNPAWLVYAGGGPHFMAGPGDPEGFLYRGSQNADGTRDGDQMQLIDKLKNTGANSIYMQAIRSHGGDGDDTHNPFIGNDEDNGINQAVLDQWKTWFTEMDENGIVIYFFFYDDSASVWNTGNNVGAEEKQFINAIVNNFKQYKNLIWVVAEEYEEVFSAQRISNIAAEIRNADEHKHVIAVHKLPEIDFSEFENDPNIDQFAIQCCAEFNANDFHDEMVAAWELASNRYNLNMSESAPGLGTGSDLRRKSWAIALGGAYVMSFEMDIESTPTSDLEDMGRLVSFMESTNFNEMAPHDELSHAGTDYVLASPGKSYIAYSSSAGGALGLKNLPAGDYRLEWFNPINGDTVNENVSTQGGNQSWNIPSQFGNEVALYVNQVGNIDTTPPAAPSNLSVQ